MINREIAHRKVHPAAVAIALLDAVEGTPVRSIWKDLAPVGSPWYVFTVG